MLKRKPSLTTQARAHLKQRIIDDEFEDGRIPSETDLAQELGVSRTTIRDALARLELEGVIYRKQGSGTFVNKPALQIQTRLQAMWDYSAVLADHGYEATTQILDVQTVRADSELAASLLLPEGAEVVRVTKLFLADDEPVILAFNHVPHHLIVQPYTQDDFHKPIYQFLWDFCEQHLTYYLSEIVPALATPDLQQPLHLRQERPLLSFEEVGFNDDNQPVLKAISYFRDDLLRFRLIRREVA